MAAGVVELVACDHTLRDAGLDGLLRVALFEVDVAQPRHPHLLLNGGVYAHDESVEGDLPPW
eukprot:3660484-Rhodomonas_salina.1